MGNVLRAFRRYLLTTSGADATEQFRAYGAVRGYSGSNPSRYQFTGQYIDNTGFYYYNARYYDPQIGTFLSPDTLVPDPGNVQAYNRYLYALGNPSSIIIRRDMLAMKGGIPFAPWTRQY